MLDPLDYMEPACPLCSLEPFMPNSGKPAGMIPVPSVIGKLDGLLNREDYPGAKRLLLFWQEEARLLQDKRGELSIQSELMGLARKLNDKELGLEAVRRGMALIEALDMAETISAGVIWLNAATTLKAFGKAEEAIPVYEKAQARFMADLPADDPRFAGLYNNMALAYFDLGDYEKAEALNMKALAVMAKQENGELDAAITWLNLAELYEAWHEDSAAQVEACVDTAWKLLQTPALPRNGYYAFVCRKCAPTFDYFGYFAIKNSLNKMADEIYAGN